MKAYSIDLRQKIVRAWEGRVGSQRAIAELFSVSPSFVEKLLQRQRSTGSVAARPHAGGRRCALDEASLALLQGLVQEQADASLEELCARVQQAGGPKVSAATMCRALQRLELPRKKSHCMPPNAIPHACKKRVPSTTK
jgi:transposase